ncbi:jg11423 [Pararge aegeria aegeria]|uniref:Jg11423 protein n=1 Tax=Pararge aegeria aegeria TaxID=348720 RepID=A0A8S4QY74_9NEOP|nr:jg11423 [Pararge aegeria aegeria]
MALQRSCIALAKFSQIKTIYTTSKDEWSARPHSSYRSLQLQRSKLMPRGYSRFVRNVDLHGDLDLSTTAQLMKSYQSPTLKMQSDTLVRLAGKRQLSPRGKDKNLSYPTALSTLRIHSSA